MATVEEIYRKIRRGDTADIHVTRVSDGDLESGVERIRARLSQQGSASTVPSRTLIFRPQIWLPALAAICLIAVLLWPKTQPAPKSENWAAGTVRKFGSVEIKALVNSRYAENFAASQLTVKLYLGTLLITRRDAATGLKVATPEGEMSAQGTVFVVEFDKQTSVYLLEGRLLVQLGAAAHVLDEKNNKLGRDLTAVAAPYRKLLSPRSNAANVIRSAFRAGECVIYYRNNEKRRGKIYAEDRAGRGYVVHGASGPEPGYFADDALFHGSCSE